MYTIVKCLDGLVNWSAPLHAQGQFPLWGKARVGVKTRQMPHTRLTFLRARVTIKHLIYPAGGLC